MSKPVLIDDEAEIDLAGAAARYEKEKEFLGARLIVAVEAAINLIFEYPLIGGPAPGVPEHVGARHVLVSGFPFSVVYIDLPEETRVVAIAHTSRKPGYWIK